MTLGFSDADRVARLRAELSTWELYQVQIDKYYMTFYFENGYCSLNVAYRFSFRSADGSVDYTYDVQAPGDRKMLNLDSVLRRPIRQVEAFDDRRLGLIFDNGDTLTIHDSPIMRSAWFYRIDPTNPDGRSLWFVEDAEPEDVV